MRRTWPRSVSTMDTAGQTLLCPSSNIPTSSCESCSKALLLMLPCWPTGDGRRPCHLYAAVASAAAAYSSWSCPAPTVAAPTACVGCGSSTWMGCPTPRCRACTWRTCRCTRRPLRAAARRQARRLLADRPLCQLCFLPVEGSDLQRLDSKGAAGSSAGGCSLTQPGRPGLWSQEIGRSVVFHSYTYADGGNR
jgi:hypothetical protein